MNRKYRLSEFKFSKNDRVFKYPEKFIHSYSDDSDVEKKIFDILKNSKDNSVSSNRLSNHIESWPTEYHFSPIRYNLLRHLDLHEKTFLELGAGCGALTRFIGENAKTVVAIEGSLLRAKCASQRCKDLENVEVYCANFNNVLPEKKFDYVSLIGVLEYASIYTNSESPFKDCLALAAKFLKSDGRLIIAIENRLGLKYFSGISEDHTSKPYFGLYDLYKMNTARTFGKFELIELLKKSGLKHSSFFYPFPDYKLPTVLLTENSLNEKINISDILFRILPRDYSKKGRNNFYNNLVWSALEKNNLIDQLSNSFLVISATDQIVSNNSDLVYQYTTDRKSQYNVTTKFSKVSKDIQVSKESMSKGSTEADNSILKHRIKSEKYIYGSLLEKEISRAVVAERMDDLLEYLNLWLNFLKGSGLKKANKNIFLSEIKNDYFDCIPQNLIVKDKKIFYIDREWEITNGMTLYQLILKYFSEWDKFKIDFIDKYYSNGQSYLVNVLGMMGIPIIKEEFYQFEMLINNIYRQVLKNDYRYEFNYYLLKRSKSFYLKKAMGMVLRLLKIKKNER